MSDRFKRLLTQTFIKESLAITIWEALKAILGFLLTTTAFVFLSRLLTTFVSSLLQFKWYIAVLFWIGGALLFIFLYERFSRFRPRFPRLDCDFSALEVDLSYEYKDKSHMTYKRKRLLQALKNSLGTYHDKYLWTGDGVVLLTSGIREQQVQNTIRKGVWQCYEIKFEKMLAKGESIPTEVIWELEDKAGSALPFFSTTVEEPTDVLRFNLILNPDLGVSKVTCEVSSGIGATKPFKSQTLTLNKHGEVTWEIRRPKLLYHYEMKWIF